MIKKRSVSVSKRIWKKYSSQHQNKLFPKVGRMEGGKKGRKEGRGEERKGRNEHCICKWGGGGPKP